MNILKVHIVWDRIYLVGKPAEMRPVGRPIPLSKENI
jgi:hypothetical protein